MQHPDVEKSGDRRRVVCSKILSNFWCGETLSMDRQPQFVVRKALRLGGPKNVDVLGRTQLFDQFAGGVVVSVDQINIDAGICEAGHLLIEKQRRFKTLEPGVVKVARDYEKVNALGDGGIQYFLERASRRIPNFLYRSSGVFSETLKRRVKMNICAVDEFHLLGFPQRR